MRVFGVDELKELLADAGQEINTSEQFFQPFAEHYLVGKSAVLLTDKALKRLKEKGYEAVSLEILQPKTLKLPKQVTIVEDVKLKNKPY